MSKLSNLIGKGQAFKIGDIDLEFKPLKFENMDLLAKLDNKDTQVKAMQEIISITLKDAVPDATDEEIQNLGLNHMLAISKAIKEVNGLKDATKTD